MHAFICGATMARRGWNRCTHSGVDACLQKNVDIGHRIRKGTGMSYVVYATNDRDQWRIGSFSSYTNAEKAARKAVAGNRGSVAGCIPACADPEITVDGFCDRDGDTLYSWIEQRG
jgi:hypothetical protein